jgi:hypothetical protein
MADNRGPTPSFAMIVGGVVLLALAVFLVTGGDLGGTKKIEGDHDLPQVTSPQPSSRDANTGLR